MWQRALAAVAIGLMLAGPVAGCARPQRRPEVAQMSPQEMSLAVAKVAALDSGGGDTAGVVFDKNALIAIQLNVAQPGGTNGQPLTGTLDQSPGHDMTDAGRGPPDSGAGPGGSVGIAPAMPGGGLSPGGATPGGSPVHTQAVPNASGGPATDSGTNAPVASPGSMGYAPMDVFHRIANQVKSRFPTEITEVRFAYIPDDARRVLAIYRAIEGGASVDQFRDELTGLWNRAAPAGVTEFDPMSPQPAQNPVSPGPNP